MMVRLTIDGKQIMVDAHMNILEAAKKLGIQIPTFCYLPAPWRWLMGWWSRPTMPGFRKPAV
jgi:hypothetical protein